MQSVGLIGSMSNRILDVLEAVAVYGPSTLDQLYRKLPRTRSSVYRALIELEKNGWVRRSLNGRSFFVSSKMEKLSDLHFSLSDDFDRILILLRSKTKGSNCYLNIVCHIRADDFAIVDSNLYPLPRSIDCNDLKLYLSKIVNFLRESGLLPFGSQATSKKICSNYDCSLEDLLKNGFLFEETLGAGIVPFLLDSGELIMIICRSREVMAMNFSDAQRFTENLFEEIARADVFNFRKTSIYHLEKTQGS